MSHPKHPYRWVVIALLFLTYFCFYGDELHACAIHPNYGANTTFQGTDGNGDGREDAGRTPLLTYRGDLKMTYISRFGTALRGRSRRSRWYQVKYVRSGTSKPSFSAACWSVSGRPVCWRRARFEVILISDHMSGTRIPSVFTAILAWQTYREFSITSESTTILRTTGLMIPSVHWWYSLFDVFPRIHWASIYLESLILTHKCQATIV